MAANRMEIHLVVLEHMLCGDGQGGLQTRAKMQVIITPTKAVSGRQCASHIGMARMEVSIFVFAALNEGGGLAHHTTRPTKAYNAANKRRRGESSAAPAGSSTNDQNTSATKCTVHGMDILEFATMGTFILYVSYCSAMLLLSLSVVLVGFYFYF